MKRINIIVSGLVQGVGYRYFCSEKAKIYGIKGYAKNLYNGNVEVDAEGEEGMLNDFIKELKTGPIGSYVKGVMITEVKEFAGYKDFRIRFN